MEAAATDHGAGARGGRRSARGRLRAPAAGPDRASVILLSLAAVLAVLALLAWELRSAPPRSARRAEVVLRRVYQTTVVETIVGSRSAAGTSVLQSVSSSGSGYSPVAAPTTRSSSH
jgi:hypothetical protein